MHVQLCMPTISLNTVWHGSMAPESTTMQQCQLWEETTVKLFPFHLPPY